MTTKKIKELIELAKSQGCTQATIDGNTYVFDSKPHHEAITTPQHVPDMKAEELIQPESVFDQMTEEEILYWATPYYDEVVAKKESQKKRTKNDYGELE